MYRGAPGRRRPQRRRQVNAAEPHLRQPPLQQRRTGPGRDHGVRLLHTGVGGRPRFSVTLRRCVRCRGRGQRYLGAGTAGTWERPRCSVTSHRCGVCGDGRAKDATPFITANWSFPNCFLCPFPPTPLPMQKSTGVRPEPCIISYVRQIADNHVLHLKYCLPCCSLLLTSPAASSPPLPMQYPPDVRPELRIIDYIREIADDRKARSAGLIDTTADTPEMLLEKVRGSCWPGAGGGGRWDKPLAWGSGAG